MSSKISEKKIVESSNRILQSLLNENEDDLNSDDDFIIELPLFDFLIRRYNKASHMNKKRYRMIRCTLCDKEFKMKDKRQHINTSYHSKRFLKTDKDDDEIFVDVDVKENNE